MYTSESEIEDFLTEYQRTRIIIEATARTVMMRAVEYEGFFDKPFYYFTTEEALEMFKNVHAISVNSLQNMNLLLKNASKWFLFNKGKSIDNVYEQMTKDILINAVDINKQKSLIFSRSDINNLQINLLNEIDQAILEMLFLGFGGQWLKELTFFEMSQVDTSDLTVYFRTGKSISITRGVYELLKRACAEDELVSFGITSRVAKVTGPWIYKVRFNALSTNSDWNNEEDAERRYRFVQRRLKLISDDLGVKLTSGGIQTSGLLHYIQLGIRETNMAFREFVKTEQAREIARRYDIYSDLYSQILVEKFEQYFI